jgi:hypothetical protein
MEGAFDIGALSKAKEDWVLDHHRSIGQAPRLHVLDPRAHRRHAVRADRHVERAALTPSATQVLRGLMGEAYHRALMAFPDEDVVVGSGSSTPTASRRSGTSSTTSRRLPARRRSARSGRGAVGWRSASASTPSTTPSRSSPSQRQSTGSSTTSRRKPEKLDADVVEMFGAVAARQGRRHGGLRLDDGRGSRQARTALSRWASSPTSSTPADDPGVRRSPDPGRTARGDRRPGVRAPSAGKTQGWHLVVLEGDDTARFWDITLPPMQARLVQVAAPARRAGDRCSRSPTPRRTPTATAEPDKAATGLGPDPSAWPVPYWTIDASMAVMTHPARRRGRRPGCAVLRRVPGERELRQRSASRLARVARRDRARPPGATGGRFGGRCGSQRDPERRRYRRRDHPPRSLVVTAGGFRSGGRRPRIGLRPAICSQKPSGSPGAPGRT